MYGRPAVPTLVALLGQSPDVAHAAANSLVQIGGAAEEELARRYCKTPLRLTESEERRWAIYVLARLGNYDCTNLVADALIDVSASDELRGQAIEAVQMLDLQQLVPSVRSIVSSGPRTPAFLAQWAAWCLGEMRDHQAAQTLATLLQHDDGKVRYHTYMALMKIGDLSVSKQVCNAAAAEGMDGSDPPYLEEAAQEACLSLSKANSDSVP
jgi:HEAT repeat protein